MADLAGESIDGALELAVPDEDPHPPFAPGVGDDAAFGSSGPVAGLTVTVGRSGGAKGIAGT